MQSVHETAAPRLSTLGSWTGSIIRNSLIYRWLTTEPEPEVIVIDLQNTHTIGPFITLLDSIVDALVPYFEESHLKSSIDVLATWATTVADSRIGHLLVRFFEPPAAPDQTEQTNHHDDSERN
ncbi:hypothetical protein ATH50_0778 [Haloplanus aerogenes]|uniref:Uncharacterized protein n=1 Tax=Haloplanus aerogenes TaxID=660522 RepID=A0A3M0E5N1_9EURY|nr:hypothetical protein ATH50_0778 [Haloplanus aerogenes]